jgi:hypothetical protein
MDHTLSTSPSWSRSYSFAFSVALTLLLLILTSGRIFLWDKTGIPLTPNLRFAIPIILVICLSSALARYRATRRVFLAPWHTIIPLVLVIFSGWLDDDYSLLRVPTIRGELFLFSLASYLSLQHLTHKTLRALCIFLCMTLMLTALYLWGEHLLSSDDHLTFIFRLKNLQKHFPYIPFYFPGWNAGLDARSFFATGALNIYFLSSPLLAFFEVEKVYNLIVSAVLFIVVPFCSWHASRLVSSSRSAPWIASLLSVSSSLLWYRWALKYGTMGCIVSCALFPLVTVLLIKAFWRQKALTWRNVFFTWLTTTLMLFWSPSGLGILPLVGAGLYNIRSVLRDKKRLTLLSLLIVSNLLWIPLFLKVSRVGSFLVAEHKTEEIVKEQSPTYHAQGSTFRHKKGPITVKTFLKRLKETSSPSNPLILFCGILALFALNKTFRLPLVACCLWLALLSVLGPLIKPQLELDRMFLFLLFLLNLAAVDSVSRAHGIYRKAPNKKLKILLSLAFGFIFTSIFSVFQILHNRTIEQYSLLSPEMELFVENLKESENEGRVFFSGFLLHQFSGGHVAPLPLWTDKPMLAYSFTHNMWRKEQMIEEEFLSLGIDGVVKFLDSFNVATIIAHESYWKKFFNTYPDLFKKTGQFDRFTVFKRLGHKSNYIFEGSGKVIKQDTSSVTFTLSSKEAILKFIYYPFLEVPGCTLSPYSLSRKHTFIKLSNCPTNTPLTLRSISPLERLFL